MKAETWFSAGESVERGFADRVAEAAPKAQADWNLSVYANAPVVPAVAASINPQNRERYERTAPPACRDPALGDFCMSSIQELREKRTAKAREYRNLLDRHPESIPEEAANQFDALESEISALDDAIARHEKALAMEADRLTGEPRDERENTTNALYDKWMRNGPQALTPDDWAAVRNTMSTGTDAQGGYTVPTEVSGTIIEALKAFGGMRSVATVISTATACP